MQELHATGVRPVENAVMWQINDTLAPRPISSQPWYLSIPDVVAIGIMCRIILDSCDLIPGTVLRLYPKALPG